MTTCAYDGTTLAVDRASWKNNYVWNRTTKLFLLPKLSSECCRRLDLTEIAWAACGEAADVPLILKWMLRGGELPKPIIKEETVSRGLLLDTFSGEIYRLTSLLTLETILSVPTADGGGFELALGAMLAGADAVQAIRITASRSGWAAGGINSYTRGDGKIREYGE